MYDRSLSSAIETESYIFIPPRLVFLAMIDSKIETESLVFIRKIRSLTISSVNDTESYIFTPPKLAFLAIIDSAIEILSLILGFKSDNIPIFSKTLIESDISIMLIKRNAISSTIEILSWILI